MLSSTDTTSKACTSLDRSAPHRVKLRSHVAWRGDKNGVKPLCGFFLPQVTKSPRFYPVGWKVEKTSNFNWSVLPRGVAADSKTEQMNKSKTGFFAWFYAPLVWPDEKKIHLGGSVTWGKIKTQHRGFTPFLSPLQATCDRSFRWTLRPCYVAVDTVLSCDLE